MGLMDALGHCGITPKLLALIYELKSDPESAVRCDFFSNDTGLRQRCILVAILFSVWMVWILRILSEAFGCSASAGDVRITNLGFADDAVTFEESSDVFADTLECAEKVGRDTVTTGFLDQNHDPDFQ